MQCARLDRTWSSDMPAVRRVALVDWNWSGHHPTYFVNYAAALAELGHEVVPFGPRPEEADQLLATLPLKAEVAQRIAPAMRVHSPPPSGLRPARWRGYHDALRVFGGLGAQLRRWERQSGRKIDLVHFCCMYDRQFARFRWAERAFGFPCTGMYMEGRYFHLPGVPIPYGNGMPCPDKFLTSPLMKGVAVLDPAVVEPMRRLTGGKPVVVFPDVTHEAAVPREDPAWGLARKVEAFAAGRPVVALLGHLQWTKGLEDFTALAGHDAMKDVVFVLAGEVNWSELEGAKQSALRLAWERTPNIFTHLQPLPETTMNALMASSDVVFAAYRQFPNNSNILTKASVCERPLLVSDAYLMGNRVKEYELGEVLPEGDVEAMVSALRRMLGPGYRAQLKERARWADYRALHAAARLPQCFHDLIQQ